MESLKTKTVSGVKWQIANRLLQKVLSVLTFAFLAHILEPSVFGIFAMAFIAVDGVGIFKTLGLDSGIVQKKDCPETVKNTAFILIQLISFLILGGCFLAAPLAAKFFNRPDIEPVVKALGFFFVLNGIAKVPSALLTKEMRFRLISIIQLIGAVVNSVFAIVLAYYTRSVWGLVGAYLLREAVMAALIWAYSGYRIRLEFSFRTAIELFDFGKFMVGIGLLFFINDNVSNVIVGKVLGATILGYYALATSIGNFINTNFTLLISRVMFPAYSQIQDDPVALKKAYLKTLKFVSMISFPFAIFLICLSKEAVLTLYGEKWLPMVPLLRLFGLVQLIVPLKVCSGPVFLGCGRPKYDFFLTLSFLTAKIPLVIFFTKSIGASGAIIGELIAAMIFAPINFSLVRTVVGFQYREFFATLLPSIACSLIMMISIVLAKAVFIWQPLAILKTYEIVALTIFSLAGIAAYLISFYFVDRKTSMEAKRMLIAGGAFK